MEFKEFITWLYEQDTKGNLKEDAKIIFFADFGDAGYNEVTEAEIDKDGNIIISGH